jgi:hypothetical protein
MLFMAPPSDVWALSEAKRGFGSLESGERFRKIVVSIGRGPL